MQYLIFANGDPDLPTYDRPPDARIIGVDGGLAYCRRLGLIPDVLIGDLDSVNPDDLQTLEAADVEVYRYPADKDETDLELAINYAADNGATQIVFFGLLGGRWDMSFANILLLASPRYKNLHLRVVGASYDLYILWGGRSITLDGDPGDLVSVLSLSGDAQGVTYDGLAWPLKQAELAFGSPLGVSNNLLEPGATITLETGVLLIVHSTQVEA